MKELSLIYKVFNLTNLDVALGAVALSIWLCHMFNVELPWLYIISLGLVVWSIYIIDQLYDARRKEAVSHRRLFYKRHWGVFLGILIINLTIAVVLIGLNFQLRKMLYIIPAIALSGFYILTNWKRQSQGTRFYLKEFIIALGYTTGILAIPLAFGGQINIGNIWIILAIFFMAMWNVLLLAFYEREQNQLEKQTSLSQWLNGQQIQRIAFVCYGLMLATVLIYFFLGSPGILNSIIWITILIYMVLPFTGVKFIQKEERYRRYLDQVFLLAALSLFQLAK